MKKNTVLFVCLFIIGSLSAEPLELKIGSRVWIDRDYVIAELPPNLEIADTADKISCDKRLIAFPAGCTRALIALYDCPAGNIIAQQNGMLRYPGKLRLVREKKRSAQGDNYQLWVIENPQTPVKTEATTAGGILLAVNENVPTDAELSAPSEISGNQAVPVPENLTGLQKFSGQEYRFRPGAREVEVYIRAPQAGITPQTGLMLVSHNWGGTWKLTAPWCDLLAERFNLICLSVNYLQSGEAEHSAVPYDHGLLQAGDCLRALFEVQKRLDAAGIPFNRKRIYAAGASGGGNVSLMVNKLAPATFACIIDLCGMPGLTDEIAYGQGHLNAGYSQDKNSPKYLTPAMQEIRDPGNLEHLKLQYRINPANQVVIVHGLSDTSCNPADKMSLAANMVRAGFKPATHFLTAADVDGKVVTNTRHDIGNRPEVIAKFGGAYINPDSVFYCELKSSSNLDAKDEVVYPVTGGRYIISFKELPTIYFEAD